MTFEVESIWRNSPLIKKRTGFSLEDIIIPRSRGICLYVIKKCGFCIYYIKDQDKEICLEAVRENGIALQFIEKQDIELCLNAIKQTPDAHIHITSHNTTIIKDIFKDKVKIEKYPSFYSSSYETSDFYCKLHKFLNVQEYDMTIHNEFETSNLTNNTYHSRKEAHKRAEEQALLRKQALLMEQVRIREEALKPFNREKVLEKVTVYDHFCREYKYYQHKSINQVINDLGQFTVCDKHVYFELYFDKDMLYTIFT